MSKVIVAPLAKQDLDEIFSFFAEDSPIAAIDSMEIFQQKFELLSTHPEMGRRRNEFRSKSYRSFAVGNFIIFYQPVEGGVRIARVLHGARDVESLLE